MSRPYYERICADLRLRDGTLWPMPVTLDVPEQVAQQLQTGAMLTLRDGEGVMIAVLRVDDVWQPDREAEAQSVLGTTSREHPGVKHLTEDTHPWYLGGELEGLRYPLHYDYRELRRTPQELRNDFARAG
jgi:sulfate adenylyltransferase